MRPPRTLLDHLPGGDLGAEKGALEIDRHHPVILVLGGVEHRSTSLDAGVVYHDVDAAEPANGRVDKLLQVGELADVGLDADRLVAESGDLLLEHRGRLRSNDIVDDDTGALPREFENNRLPDAAIAAGDDGNLVLQRHDRSSP